MCTTNTSTVPKMHHRAATATSDLQEARRLHREDRARTDGSESLQTDNNTQGGGYDARDQGAEACVGVADGARTACDLLSLADTRSLCGVLSQASLRAARGLPVNTVPAQAADHRYSSASRVLLLS